MQGTRVATREYTEDAQARYALAHDRLSERSKKCLRAAYSAARELDNDHVGTEHVVLGLYDAAPEINDALRSVGISRRLFVEGLEEEDGCFPEEGFVYPTPRAVMISGIAGELTDGPIEPVHVALAAVEESRMWRGLGYDGPHHLATAAEATGATLDDVEAALVLLT